jgi:hypothetical protein
MKTNLTACIIVLGLFCAHAAAAQTPPEQAPPPAAEQPAPQAPAQPAETQPAPANTDWMTYKNPYAGEENNLANPHRTAEEISAWAQQAATDALSFTPANYKDKLNGFKKYFMQQGWQLYADFLKNSNLLNTVTNDGYSVGALADSRPETVNSGPINGIYHWIVKVPVTISFYTLGADGKAKPGMASKYTLFMDMARTTEGGGDDGIAINNWRMDEIPKP